MAAEHQAPHTGAQRIRLVKNQNYIRNGTMSYGHLLRKYGFKPTLETPFTVIDELVHADVHPIPAHFRHKVTHKPAHVATRKLMKMDAHGHVGEVEAQDVQNDSEYLGQVSFWSTKLPSSTVIAGQSAHHAIFDPALSHTYKCSPEQSWNITYGDGSTASGIVGIDTVDLGGVKIQNQAVELATKLSAQFQQGQGDGLLGLAFSNLNTVTPTPVKTPVDNMIGQSSIQASSELFTAQLASWKDASNPVTQGQSFYTFGYIDQDVVRATGNQIHYAAVDRSSGFWKFESASFSVNGTTFQRAGTTAIADTGTTLALMDDHTVKTIYAQVPGATFCKDAGGYIFPSSTSTASLPTVKVAVGDQLFAFRKEDLAFANAGNGFTYGGIQSRGDLAFDILGDTFLKSVYAIFDIWIKGDKRFGCVQSTDLDSVAVTPSMLASAPALAQPSEQRIVAPAVPVPPPTSNPAIAVAPPSATTSAAPAPAPASAPMVSPMTNPAASAVAPPPPTK